LSLIAGTKSLIRHSQKNKIKNFLILKIEIASFSTFSKGLDNSLAQLAGELCWCKMTQKSGSCETFRVIR